MYIRFTVGWSSQIQELNQQIESWCLRHGARHAKKVIKNHLRLTFDQPEFYSAFALTWTGQEFEFVNINIY
jgi:hypothetical protein